MIGRATSGGPLSPIAAVAAATFPRLGMWDELYRVEGFGGLGLRGFGVGFRAVALL